MIFEYQRHIRWIVCEVNRNYMLYLSNKWKERNTNPLREYSYYLGSTLLYGSCFLGLVRHDGLTSSAYNVACVFGSHYGLTWTFMFLHCLLFWNQAKWKHMRCGAIYSCSSSSLRLTMPVISAKPFHNTHNQPSSLPSFISPAWPQPGNSLHRTLIVFKQRASVSQERQPSK